MVYVISQNGQPLMPTENHAKVRILLKNKKAKVIKKCPFTIQLAYDSTNYTQDITLGVDSGSKHIGLSATTEDKVLFESDVELRNDIVNLISTRRQNRRTRRNRKTRYRKPRFNNRKRNQASYTVMEFRLYDKVMWKGQKCFIFGRRSTGRMDIRLLNGTKINTSVGHKNLRLIEMRKNYLIEQRKVG